MRPDQSSAEPSRRSPWRFFVLVFLLALPFWIVSAQWGAMFLPGLPAAALAVVCPAFAAMLLVFRTDGGVSTFLIRSLKPDGAWLWMLRAILLSLAVGAATLVVLHVTQGARFAIVRPPKLVAMAMIFVLAAWCEELGWSGYATDPLQARWGTLRTALIIGLVWAAWHFVPLAQAGRGVEWIAWWTLGTLATRIVIVGFYNASGGSVLVATLFHATSNLCVFAMTGTYDVRVTTLALAALAALFVRFGLRAQADRRARPFR